MRVSQVLRVKGSTLFTVSPETSLPECIKTMADNDIGSLVVLEKGHFVGMLTFKELLHFFAKHSINEKNQKEFSNACAGSVLNPKSLFVAPSTDVTELIEAMLKVHQRYVPVLEGTVLLGVVSFHDLAKAVAEKSGFENRMLKAYIRDWPVEG